MHITARSYLTAGVALVGAGAIALTPVQPIPAHLSAAPQRVVADLAVNLAATVDPIQLWKETLQNTADNIKNLHFSYWQTPDNPNTDPRPVPGPFPIMSSILYNQYVYIQEIPDFGKIFGQISDNLKTFFSVQREVLLKPPAMDALHKIVWQVLPQLVDIPPQLQPLLDLTTTYSSGQLIGLIGPGISSTLALVDSIKGIFGAPDFQSAINEIINIPANQVNAFLNGGKTLDLTKLVSGLLPPEVTKFAITFGGLLSPAGSIFNSLELGTSLLPVPIRGNGAGGLGSSIELGKQIGEAILVPNVPPWGPAASTAAALPAAATAKPAPAAAVSAPQAPAPAVDNTPAAPVVADTPAAPAAPVVDNTPAAPAVAEAPAAPVAEAPAPAVVDVPVVEAPAPEAVSAPAPAVDTTPAPAHRGGAGNSDNGGHSGGKGHRGAA